MATQALELVNPYSKLGLKRRPTYDEIINLIDENETITGKLPDRTATFYKASPEGSFFDGTDHLEILKEQQNRILEREMRGILMRQNARVNGRTFNVDRIQSSSGTALAPTESIQADNEFQMQSLIEQSLKTRETLKKEREKQTGIAHREGFFLGTPSLVESFGRTRVPTIERETIPEARTPIQGDEESEPELIPDEAMTGQQEASGSASAGVLPFLDYELDNNNNPKYWIDNYRSMKAEMIKFQLFLRGIQIPTEDSIQEQLKPKGRGKDEQGKPLRTYKEYLHGMILDAINQGGWKIKMTNQEYEDKKKEWKRGKGKFQ